VSAERGRIIGPQPVSDPAAGWVVKHRDQGHHPHPAPTPENPERWDCDCGYIWRILTVEQIRQKFAHLSKAAEARRKGIPLPCDDPAWQERIRRAKQLVAEDEARRNEC
jgi:hypothetical protein